MKWSMITEKTNTPMKNDMKWSEIDFEHGKEKLKQCTANPNTVQRDDSKFGKYLKWNLAKCNQVKWSEIKNM